MPTVEDATSAVGGDTKKACSRCKLTASLGTNTPELDFVVRNTTSYWEDLARQLLDFRSWEAKRRFYEQEQINQIQREKDSGRARCREAVLQWLEASPLHNVDEIVAALRKLGKGKVAEELSTLAQAESKSGEPKESRGIEQAVRARSQGIPQDHIIKEDVLFRSSTACIFAGKWKGGSVAIKTTPESTVTGAGSCVQAERLEALQAEYDIHQSARHPNIVEVYDVCWLNSRNLGIVMQRMELSLYQHLQYKDLMLADQIDIALDISRAVCHLHGLNIVHGSLNSTNVLLCFSQRERRLIAKVSDFSRAKRIRGQVSQLASTSTSMSPSMEMCCQDEFAADVYDVGVLGLEIATSTLAETEEKRASLLIGLQEPAHHPLYSFIDACLKPNETHRLPIGMIHRQLLDRRYDDVYRESCQGRASPKSHELAQATLDPATHLKAVGERLKWKPVHNCPVMQEECREISAVAELDNRLYVSFNVKPNGVRVYSTTDLDHWNPVKVPSIMDYCYGLAVADGNLYSLLKPLCQDRCVVVQLDARREPTLIAACPITQFWPAIQGSAGRLTFYGGFGGERVQTSGGRWYRRFNKITVLDLKSKEWTVARADDGKEERIPTKMAAPYFLSTGDRSFLVGGYHEDSAVKSVPVHELKAGRKSISWDELPEVRTKPQVGATAYRHLIFLAGGQYSRNCYCLNPATCERFNLPPIPEARTHPALTVFRNKLVLIGGQDADDRKYADYRQYCNIHTLDLELD